MTGRPCTKEQMEAAIQKGPHVSSLAPDAIDQLAEELREKVKSVQAQVVLWDDIRANPPP
jgi:hypothetical protein